MAHVRAAMHTTGGTKRSRTRRKAFNDEMKDMLKELTGQENLLLNGSDLFLVLDASGVVTYCSASVPSILFHAVEEIENQFLALYARPSSRAVLATVLHQAQHTAATQPLHLRLWRPDGALVHLEGVVGRRSLSPICTTDHPTARSVASKLAQMPPPTGGVPSGGPPPDGDYELPLVLWVAHETPAFPQAEATLQAAEQRLQQEDAQEAAWVPPGVVNSAGQSPAGALEGNDRNDPGAGDENGSNGATVPQGPTKEEQNGASAERQPQAVAPFHGVAPFAGNQLNTAAFFGSPHPRGWGEDNLAADLPLARVQGDFGEVKTALAALAAATGPPSSHTCDLPPVPPQGTGALCRSPPPPPPTPPARSRRGHFPPRDQGLP